jgi:glycosyltransferase involved in cell wall biosynthesis
MKVLFDHQIFERQRWGGISRYFVELLRGLGPGVDVELALERTHSELRGEINALLGLAASDAGFNETFLGGRRFPGRKQLWSVAKRAVPGLEARRVNRKASLARIAAGEFDLLHPTYFDPYFLPALGRRPYVLTVYDMTYEVFPELFSAKDPVPGWKRVLVEGASRIIAISEHTKRDLVRILGVDPHRVDVTHLAYAPPPAAESPRPPRTLPERFVLFTGTRHAYKNWGTLVEALAPLLRADTALHLVCTGHPFTDVERARLAERGLDRQVLQVRVDEAELGSLYERALAFVFPSRYEGFGLPVLEAFWHGCPALLARSSSLPEVGGDAALYFDPSDPADLGATVARALADAELRADLVRRGRERVRAFTWARTCEGTLATYARALSGR